jgi:nucleotide-binding universal stress UspA family protein
VSILERLLSQNGRTTRMNGHDSGHDADNGAQEPKMDMLPLSAAVDPNCAKYLVLVSLTGAALDNQLMAVACSVAKTKQNVEVRAIYGIEVPRTLPVNAEMPEKTRQAEEALKNAAAIARKFDVTIGQDVLQSRHLGQSLVDASGAHGCALVIIGVPYHLGMNGEFELGETVDYLLKNAPSRVWVIRGQPGDVPATPERAKEQAKEQAAAR